MAYIPKGLINYMIESVKTIVKNKNFSFPSNVESDIPPTFITYHMGYYTSWCNRPNVMVIDIVITSGLVDLGSSDFHYLLAYQ